MFVRSSFAHRSLIVRSLFAHRSLGKSGIKLILKSKIRK